MKQLIGSVFFVLLNTILFGQFYSGSYQEFGKNRVQYNQFLWKNQNFERFTVHYYPGEEKLVEYCAKTVHAELLEIEKFFDYRLEDRLDIIIFGSKAKFNQSNIGITRENSMSVGGMTRIVGSKLFVYYEGTHEQLNRQIRATLAEVMLNKMLFEGDWKDVLKANALASFPEWYINGFVSYMSRPWDAYVEARVKDGFLSGRYEDFSRLEGEEAEIAGHAMWHFIDITFGKEVIPNIVYLTRITRNPDRGFTNVIGGGVNELIRTMADYYKSEYAKEVVTQDDPDTEEEVFKRKKGRIYYGFKASPDGRFLAYVENHLGKYKVKLLDRSSRKTKTIFSAEPRLYRTIDRSFPTLTWHPQSAALAFVTERKGELRLYIHTLEDGKNTRRVLHNLDKVLSMDYSDDGKMMVFSGVSHGYTDLYLYSLQGNSHKKLTDDIWDDTHPRFVENSTRIIFSSNRMSDTIYNTGADPEIQPIKKRRDIFILDLNGYDKSRVKLLRITDTPFADEVFPIEYSKGEYAFLSDESGVYNVYRAKRDSVITHIDTVVHYNYFSLIRPVTNWNSSILEIEYDDKAGELLALINRNRKYKLVRADGEKEVETPVDVRFKQEERIREEQRNSNTVTKQVETVFDYQSQKDSIEGGKLGHIRIETREEDSLYRKRVAVIGRKNQQNGFVYKESAKGNKNEEDIYAYEKPREVVYSVNFAKDFVVAQLDNQFMSQAYQRYSGPGTVFFNPGLNALAKVGFSDVFEDYKLVGGMRIPFDLASGEFLGEVYFLKKRLDHRLILYRQSLRDRDRNTGAVFKWAIHEVKHFMSYPFSETWSLRGIYGYRFDRNTILAVSDQTLAEPTRDYHQASARIELVFDNARKLQLNIQAGTKFKFFVEYMNQFSPYGNTLNIGLDFRHYQRLFKNFIWVNRLAGATSLGNQRLVYYMGGVDNWMIRPNPHFDQTVEVDPNQSYGYQTLASPMRGFLQNSRNGNSFAVWNSELRLPVVSFFSKYPVKSEFLRSFQIIGFMDLGTAWTGPHPYSPENYFNTQVIEQKPITIKIKNAREPLILGFGTGLRAMLFGYFMRLDFGWGLNDGVVANRPRVQFSLGFDI